MQSIDSNPIHIYLPNLSEGGAQHVMIRLANYFASQGHASTIVANSIDGVQKSKIDPNVELKNLHARNMIDASFKLASFLQSRQPPTLLCAMTFANLPAIVAKRIARVRTKIVISERHACTEWLKGRRLTRRVLYSALIPMIYPHADAIIAVSQGVSTDLAQFIKVPEASIDVIYNPAADVLTEEVKRPDVSWFLGDDCPVVLGVGRLHPQKGFDILVRAFALVLEKRSARLMIVGEGAERDRLMSLAKQLGIESNVRLPGYAADPMPYFASSQLFVLSSRYEGFPNALVEALACGTPVVSTACESGPREILENGEIAPLVPVDDVEALATAMLNELENPRDPSALRGRAATFSIEQTGAQYLEVLKRSLCRAA